MSPRTRRATLALGVLGVLAAGTVAAVSLTSGDDTASADDDTAPRNTAEVVQTDLVEETEYDATLGRRTGDAITAGREGTVTSVPDGGTTLGNGSVLYTVDATAPETWRRFSFALGSVVEDGAPAWDLAFRRYAIIASPGGGILDLGEVRFDERRTRAADTAWLSAILRETRCVPVTVPEILSFWLCHRDNLSNPQTRYVFSEPLSAVRAAVGIPVVAVGLITEYEQAEAIVATGDADMIALARTILYDPRWPWHAAAHLGASVQAAPQYHRSQPRRFPNLFASG